MNERNRRVTPKGNLEKMVGRKIDPNLLPAIHKVQIMEFLLTCSHDELVKYVSIDQPVFIVICAKMINEMKLDEYMSVLDRCRAMAREDALNAK